MAQTTLFLDTFTGADGLALSAREPETGSWVGVYDSEYVKLDGAGFAHYPGDYHEPGVPGAYLEIPLGAHPAEININSTATFKVTNLSAIDWLFDFIVELVGDDDSHGLVAVVFHDGGGVGRIDIAALGPYTSTSLTFPLTANEEFTIELSSNAGASSEHTLEVRGPGWSESVTIEGVSAADPAMDLRVALGLLDNSRVKVGSLSVVLDSDAPPPESGSYTVEGASTTMYGQPRIAHAVAGSESTQYGSILAKYDVSVSVAPQEPSTRCGTPLAWTTTTQLIGTVHDAYGVCTTQAGQPRAASPVSAQVAGTTTTGYGQVVAATVSTVQGACTTGSGQPAASLSTRAAGVCGTRYGKPSVAFNHTVKGSQRTRYGRIACAQPDAHRVYGLNNGRRAGTPRAREIP